MTRPRCVAGICKEKCSKMNISHECKGLFPQPSGGMFLPQLPSFSCITHVAREKLIFILSNLFQSAGESRAQSLHRGPVREPVRDRKSVVYGKRVGSGG